MLGSRSCAGSERLLLLVVQAGAAFPRLLSPSAAAAITQPWPTICTQSPVKFSSFLAYNRANAMLTSASAPDGITFPLSR